MSQQNPARKKFAINLTSPLSSLACDEECRMLAVGGRDTLSLIEINHKDEKFHIKKNLKKTRVDLPRQNTVYLEWNPKEANLLAAAALGGSISIWDVNFGTNANLNRVVVGHNQAINKLNWHPTDSRYLISGSHDCTARVWDIRNKDSDDPCEIIKLSSSVRDVKFVPANSDLIVVALENGAVEVWDRRNVNKCLTSNPSAHRLAILTMDFNQMKPNLLATGSIDKQIKIWDINNMEKELYRIKYLSGVGFVKWKPKEEHNLFVSSYSGDNSLSIYDSRKIHYPLELLRGHKDVVTACVYDADRDYVVTASKDGYIICHPSETSYQPMDHCNKFGLAFDLDSTVAFTFPRRKQKLGTSTNNVENAGVVENAEKVVKKNNNICVVSKLNSYLGSKFATLKDEINYYSERYKRIGEDSYEICEYNSEVSKDKKYVSKIWKDIPIALKELAFERDSSNPMNFAQFLNINSEVFDQDNTPIASADSKNPKSFLTNNDLNHLISYYEKHPEKFKSDYNEKKVVIKEGKVYIKPQFIHDVGGMIEASRKSLERLGSRQQDMKKIEKLTFDSIVKTVQELINVGELQSAYFTYFILRERISFPENFVKVWAQSYIELLRTYQFYTESNEIIRSSSLQIINDGNKKSTTFYGRCGNCRSVEVDSQYNCGDCKKFISVCTICKMPVKGLMLWCQICGHGGHYKEIYEWFKSNSECPSGCSHKCFYIKNKKAN